jgi:hypothetical protein
MFGDSVGLNSECAKNQPVASRGWARWHNMAIPKEVVPQLNDRFTALLPHLNERQRRLALAVEAPAARARGRRYRGAGRQGQRDHSTAWGI